VTKKETTKVLYDQRRFGPIKPIIAIAGIGVTLILLFVFAGGSGSPKVNNSGDKTANSDTSNSTSPSAVSQPAVIRIPDDYNVYTDKNYKISFAYPAPWADSIAVQAPDNAQPVPTSAKPALFTNYPLGSSVLNGRMLVYVDKQDAFKMLLHIDGATVAPVKLGDGYGWKVVQAGSGDPMLKVGDSYDVKSAVYQSGVTIYNFALNANNTVQSRWVMQSGDNFVAINLPQYGRLDGNIPSSSDVALYNIISNNVAKTARPTN
jgi:hypothetical protein